MPIALRLKRIAMIVFIAHTTIKRPTINENMYAITGFEATGKDKLFSFTDTGTPVDITDFSSGTQADGGATIRQAVWIANCTGDGSNIYLVVQSGSLGTPDLAPDNCLPRIADGDDRIVHVRKGCRVWAITDSAGTAKVRVVEVA